MKIYEELNQCSKETKKHNAFVTREKDEESNFHLHHHHHLLSLDSDDDTHIVCMVKKTKEE